jgi:hypothetical protein
MINLQSPLGHGAIGDGQTHPLSQRFATLAAAQKVFPAATALTDELDWAALQRMCDQRLPIQLGSRSYVLNRKLTYASAPFALIGDALQTSSLTWPASASTRGVELTQDGVGQHVTIENVWLRSGQNGNSTTIDGVGVKVTNTAGPSDPFGFQRITIRDVIISGTGAIIDPTGWKKGISCSGIIGFVGDNIGWSGPLVSTQPTLRQALEHVGAIALEFLGGGADVTFGAHLTNVHCYWAHKGVVADSNFEDLKVLFSNFVNVNTGIEHLGTTPPSDVVVNSCHINALIKGLSLSGLGFPTVTNCLIFQQQHSDVANIGIDLSSVAHASIVGNKFYKSGGATGSFTHLNAGSGCTNLVVSRNHHGQGSVGIQVAAGVTGQILDEEFEAGITTRITGGTLTMHVRGHDGPKGNWNNNGDNTAVGEVYFFSGDYMIDGKTTTPLRLNKTNGGNTLTFYNSFVGKFAIDVDGNGASFGRTGDKFAVAGATPIARPTVTGSKGGNAALASALAALVAAGIVNDSTT